MSAKAKMKKDDSLLTVFDAKPNLRTVTMFEAINRIKFLCDIDIPEDLEIPLIYLNR